MRTLAFTLFIALFLLTACNKEEAPPTPPAKPKPIQAAEKAAAIANMSTAQKIYEESCSACHTTGIMGSPKIGDKQAWAGLMEQGLEQVTNNAISGVGKMPPKGGNMGLSNAEVKAVVEYMIEQSK